jgi:hypothetical protein
VRKLLFKIVLTTIVLVAFAHISAQSVKPGADQNVSGDATDWHLTSDARSIRNRR